jgi:trk system potassium uptake protein
MKTSMKKIVISGAGEVGKHTAQVLEQEGHSVTVIETSPAAIARLENICEAQILEGSACHSDVLRAAGVPNT